MFSKELNNRHRFRRLFILLLLALILGPGCSVLPEDDKTARSPEHVPGPTHIENPETLSAADARDLELKIEEIVRSREGEYGVSLFHPRSGVRVEINADQEFEAASIAKLYTLVTLYRMAEHGEVDLEEEISILSQDIAAYGSGVLHTYPPGYAITLRECARYLISESDNTAWLMLNRYLGEEEIQREIEALGIFNTDYAGLTTTPNDVLEVLRIIANPLFTSRDKSREMLEHMTDTAFEDRIPAPLPSGVRVAHKTGSYGSSFGDAGIVFLDSGERYFLVVLSARTTEEEARRAMQEISLAAYEHLTGAGAHPVALPVAQPPDY